MPRCSHCKKDILGTPQKCGKCGVALYCRHAGKNPCQIAHWRSGHKHECCAPPSCGICLEDGGEHLGCGCRGSGGVYHTECIAKAAKAAGKDAAAYFQVCSVCKLPFGDHTRARLAGKALDMALSGSLSDPSILRYAVLLKGHSLFNSGKTKEALECFSELVASVYKRRSVIIIVTYGKYPEVSDAEFRLVCDTVDCMSRATFQLRCEHAIVCEPKNCKNLVADMDFWLKEENVPRWLFAFEQVCIDKRFKAFFPFLLFVASHLSVALALSGARLVMHEAKTRDWLEALPLPNRAMIDAHIEREGGIDNLPMICRMALFDIRCADAALLNGIPAHKEHVKRLRTEFGPVHERTVGATAVLVKKMRDSGTEDMLARSRELVAGVVTAVEEMAGMSWSSAEARMLFPDTEPARLLYNKCPQVAAIPTTVFNAIRLMSSGFYF